MPTKISGFSIVPSHPDLAAAELQLLNALGRERALARKLTPAALAALDIEYLLIDSPPSLMSSRSIFSSRRTT